MPHNIFGWSYPPGCSGPPDDEPPECFCGLPVRHWSDYCGASCEQMDQEGPPNPDWNPEDYV